MTEPTSTTLDAEIAAAFGERITRLVNDGLLSVMVSIGHRTRLFDTMAGMPPATSAEIAEAADLEERYVREWLAAMATGGIVRFDPERHTFHLPPERAMYVTRAGGPMNAAAWTSFVGFLAPVEDRIVDCFRNGGGLTYDDYPGFVKAMAIQSRRMFDATLVDGTIPVVTGLKERLESGIDVADVGCGAGHAVNLLARAFPASRFTGIDILEEGLELGRAESQEWGLTNTSFERSDASELGIESAFDFVTTFVAIHDQTRPRDVLRGIARSLRPGGVYLCVDSGLSSDLADNLDHDMAPFQYSISTLHCMAVALAAGGEGIGEGFGGPLAPELLAEAGFGDVRLHQPGWHPGFDYYECRVG